MDKVSIVRTGGSVVAAVLAVLLVGCGGGGELTTFENPSEAMNPTLGVGEELHVNLDAYKNEDPQVGDIVIFHPPAGADSSRCGNPHSIDQSCAMPTDGFSRQVFIKRIAAGPGDELAIEDGLAVIDGKRKDEPFAAPCTGTTLCNFPKPITIEADHYFMLGDNRPASDDSRFWGPVPKRAILGRVELDN